MYTPNYNDPRVKNRIIQAIAFVEQYVSKTKPNWLSTRAIDKHFGQGQLDISKFLRQKLLIIVDNHFNFETGKCKTYIQNPDGVNELRQALGGVKITPKITPQLQTQLNTGLFEYNDSSDRLFNPLQNLPRYVKKDILSNNGYKYNFDIECAAPTLLYQYAQRSGLNRSLQAIEAYIEHRSVIREELCILYKLDIKQVKQLINALFQGAYLSVDHRTSIYHLLNGNCHLIRQLQSNEYLCELRSDIKSMWAVIIPDMKLKLNKKRITGRDKSAKYREIEREVMDVIKRELKRTKNKHLLQHDGWTSKEMCDVNMLRSYVRSHTGYLIKIDTEIYIN